MATHDESREPQPGLAASTPDTVAAQRAKRAMIGAWFGFYVDLFDIYLPIVVLAPAISYFVSQDLGTAGIGIVSSAIFAATLLGRPIGAAVFGRLADTVGRKRTTIIAMTGAGVATLVIALLPGYQQLGVASVVLFIAVRFIGGIFLGGEYTSANPLAMEAAPRHKRGLYSGLINTGFPLAYATVSLITLLLLYVLPSGDLNSAYVQWGWRIPFAIGALLTFGAAVFFWRSVHESETFTRASKQSADTRSPLRQLLSGNNAKSFIQVFVLMSGFWLSLQPIAASLPMLLGKTGVGLSSITVTLILVIAYLLLAAADVAAAVLSQRIGRRRFLIGASTAMATVAAAVYYGLVRFGPGNTAWAAIATVLLVVIVVGPWGVLPAYMNERFPTSVRASGYGLAYSLSVVAPSFYGFYQAGLSRFMPFAYTGIVLLVLGALLVLFGARSGPETKDIDFADELATAEPPR